MAQGDALIVTGQIDECSWLQITTPDGVEGWVSGSSQYVTLDARCTDIPEVNAPAAPPASGNSSGGQSAGGQASGNASQGCYLFQNQVGPELNITFTNKDSGKSETFKVPGNGEVEKCFNPGRYTYTLDAPPPWGSTNGELTVEAGDNFLFPISPNRRLLRVQARTFSIVAAMHKAFIALPTQTFAEMLDFRCNSTQPIITVHLTSPGCSFFSSLRSLLRNSFCVQVKG